MTNQNKAIQLTRELTQEMLNDFYTVIDLYGDPNNWEPIRGLVSKDGGRVAASFINLDGGGLARELKNKWEERLFKL